MERKAEIVVKRRRDDRVIVAHISDLHFKPSHSQYRCAERQGVESRHLLDLIRRLEELKPDFLAVTGDLVDMPSESTLKAAFDFVEDLRNSSGVELRCTAVIPGNHDLVTLGLLPAGIKRKQARLDWFNKIFEGWVENREIRFDPPVTGTALNMKVACLDSNSDLLDINLAGGTVMPQRLSGFRDWMGRADVLEPFGFRMVLVHHHLLPIAEAQIEGTSAVEKEQFHLLMNAGTVMREMVACGVDLVLHGHRHFSGFARVAYPAYAYQFGGKADDQLGHFLADAAHRTISVVGAGTCGKPEKLTGPYNFNVVSLYLDGRVIVDEYERDAEQAYPLKPKRSIPLVSGAAAFASRYRWSLASLAAPPGRLPETRADLVRYSVEVTEHGDGYGRRELNGLRALGNTVEEFPFTVLSDWGYLSEKDRPSISGMSRERLSIRWEKRDDPSGEAAVPDPLGEPHTRPYRGVLRFDPPLGAEEKDAVNFVVETTVPNAFRNHRGIESSRPNEDIGFTVGTALIERLVVSLNFQDAAAPHNRTVRPKVLNPMKVEDTAETARCVLHSWQGQHAYSVDRPLPGFRYGLTWALPSRAAYERARYGQQKPEDAIRSGSYVTNLLTNAEVQAKIAGLLVSFKESVCGLMNRALETIMKSVPGISKARLALEHTDVDLSFQMIADGRLKLIASTRLEGAPWNPPFGQGISGLALRRGAVLFHNNQLEDRLPHYFPRPKNDGLKPHTWLFSMPIGFDFAQLRVPGHVISRPVGVLNISSFKHSPAIGLFFSETPNPRTSQTIGEVLRSLLIDRIYGGDGFVAQLEERVS